MVLHKGSINHDRFAYVTRNPNTQILYTEQPLVDLTRALGNYGVKDGDVVVLRQADRRPPPTQPAFPGKIDLLEVNPAMRLAVTIYLCMLCV